MVDTEFTKSEIPPEQLSLRSKFQFACHKGVKCFTDCCRGIDIMLTPYDILTIRKKLKMTSEEFLAVFTTPQILEKADLPVVTLKLLDDERKSCPFVEDEEGCAIYEDRPTTCRYYPLGVGALSYSGEKGEKDEFFFTVKEPPIEANDSSPCRPEISVFSMSRSPVMLSTNINKNASRLFSIVYEPSRDFLPDTYAKVGSVF